MKRIALVLVLSVAFFIPPGASQGQATAPLILLADNDLWLVEGTTITGLTSGRHIYGAALSPDGTRIAYNTHSQISIEAVERTGGLGGGPLPADIMILDVGSLESTAAALQPDNVSFFVEGVPDSAILRSAPTWSPDGMYLAWGEVHYPSFAAETNRIVVYNLSQGTSEILVTNLPEQAGVPMPVAPQWGGGGIAIVSYEFDTTNTTFGSRIMVYNDQSGSLISATPISEDDTEQFGSFMWVASNGQSYIAVEIGRGPIWKLLDPQTGVLTLASGLPALYNPIIPDSASIQFTPHQNAEWPEFYSWTLVYSDGRQVEGEDRIASVSHVVLGPDGQTLVQVSSSGSLSIFMPDGQIVEGPELEDRFAIPFWGPVALYMNQPEACAMAPTPRLVVGWSGHVIPNTAPNNMRTEPATGEVIGQLQPGASFLILAGPVCANGLYWWQVDNYNGLVGWTAEGDNGQYWLEPEQG